MKDEKPSILKTEVLPALVVFLSMVYTVPLIADKLSESGIGLDKQTLAVYVALAAAVFSIAMGLIGRVPFAGGSGVVPCLLYVTFAMDGIPWNHILGIGVWAGVLFALLALSGLLRNFASWIPPSVNFSMKIGIGVYLIGIALYSGKVISGTALQLESGLFIVGFALVLILAARPSTSSIAAIVGIGFVSLMALACGLTELPTAVVALPNVSKVFQPALFDVLRVEYLDEILSLTFLLAADVVACLYINASKDDKLMTGKVPKNFYSSTAVTSVGCVAAPFFGLPAMVPYFENVAGVEIGGVRGRIGVYVGIAFLLVACCSPLIAFVPPYACAVALGFVGVLIAKTGLALIDQKDQRALLVAASTTIGMLHFQSIGDGLCFAFVSYLLANIAARWGGESDYDLSWQTWTAGLGSSALFCLMHWFV